MLDLQDRLDELKGLGLYRRLRMVSGPQGPRVVLDGKPVLLLCSNTSLGLAAHPKVRGAAADAAMPRAWRTAVASSPSTRAAAAAAPIVSIDDVQCHPRS